MDQANQATQEALDRLILKFSTLQLDVGGTWYVYWFFALAAVIIYGIWKKVKLPFPLKVLLGYVLLQALFITEYPSDHFGVYSRSYQWTAAQVFIEVSLMGAGLYLFDRQLDKFLPRALPFIALFSCLCGWLTQDGLVEWPGLTNGPSFNIAFAVMTLPFLPRPAQVAVLLIAFTHHNETALLMIGAQFLAYALSRPKLLWGFVPLAGAILVTVYLHKEGMMFGGNGRPEIIKDTFPVWFRSWKFMIFGVGPGSFIWTSMLVRNLQPPIFFQMHSDFLQILWELGFVGWGLMMWSFIHAVNQSWDSIQYRASLFGIFMFSLTYFPLRFLPTALVTAWIFKRALSYKTDLLQVRPIRPLYRSEK